MLSFQDDKNNIDAEDDKKDDLSGIVDTTEDEEEDIEDEDSDVDDVE